MFVQGKFDGQLKKSDLYSTRNSNLIIKKEGSRLTWTYILGICEAIPNPNITPDRPRSIRQNETHYTPLGKFKGPNNWQEERS
jgi:hypothetical protein